MSAGEHSLSLPEEEMLLLTAYMQEKQEQVDRALEEILPPAPDCLSDIVEAMRYTLFSGGKRLRPILTLASAEAVGGRGEQALPAACAIELIHTYSLIHDDLPSVDNDDYRRGKLSNHKMFGEAMAIFAGDALLTHAFMVMTDARRWPEADPALVLRVAGEISRAVGVEGMVGGQTVDIISQGREVKPSLLDYIHSNKTAALIRISAKAGAILGGGSEEEVRAISDYGGNTGLAFQIVDDLLDVSQSGEAEGGDQQLGKATYPAVHGVEKSRQRTVQLIEEALAELSGFGPSADPLRRIACFVAFRNH